MARMKQLAPRGQQLKPRGQSAVMPVRSRERIDTWRAWYKTSEWQRLRWQVLVDGLFTCVRCQIIGQSPDLVADHIRPHRGDRDLFFDRSNLQCLCASCHNRDKQREERRGPATSNGTSGAMSRPTWFRTSYVPLTVVCGPPGSGKSTYVRTAARSGDLVICFDQIATSMFGRNGERRIQGSMTVDQMLDVLRRRNTLIAGLMRASARDSWSSAWIILTEPEAAHRQWWRDTTGADIVVLATPEAECLHRIEADDRAGDRRGIGARSAISEWWKKYTPAAGETIIVPKK